ILDWGCGSGRDALEMAKRGFEVTATDKSELMCAIARENTGLEIINESFEELKATDEYDGIWASESLLHVPTDELPSILNLASDALHEGGWLYCSFKLGTFEGERDGRYFNDMTEEKLQQVFSEEGSLSIDKLWITGDVRPGREGEQWINCLACRT
ncbi:MAG: class I SAM-dependent methyltransferase, partial [Eggerthellaceae bacterium]|nr:class I SAM-dependent methyltransferase [Eggerthellaceae bacterium]